jgi:hypothetical protein
MKATTDRSIYYDSIKFFTLPLVIWHIYRYGKVYVFDFDKDLKRNRILRHLINENKIIRIYIKPIAKEQGLALDLANEYISTNLTANCIKRVLKQYRTEEVLNVFKREVSFDFFKFFYIQSFLKENETEKDLIVPTFLYNFNILKQSNLLPDLTNTSYKLNAINYILMFFEISYCKLCYLTSALLILLKEIVYETVSYFLPHERNMINYKYAFLEQLSHEIRPKSSRDTHNIIDDTIIKNKDSVIILQSPATKETKKDYISMGRNVFFIDENYTLLRNIQLTKASTIALQNLLMLPFLLFSNEHKQNFKSFSIATRIHFKWQKVWGAINFEKLIFANFEGSSQVAVNSFLHKVSVKTYDYSIFLGGGMLRAKNKDFLPVRQLYRGFMNYTYQICFNQNAIDYYSLHYQCVHKRLALGSVFSEEIIKLKNLEDKKQEANKWFPHSNVLYKKIISVFDTTFIDADDIYTNYEDAIDFYKDIIYLLKSNDQFHLIIKPSKPEKFFTDPNQEISSPAKGEIIVKLWNELQKHDRVFWARDRKWDYLLDFRANNKIIAHSDLTISYCMSSPTSEALCSSNKAIWYEPGLKQKGLMYDDIPNLVIHGREKLCEATEKLIFDTTDEEYNNFVKDHLVPGLIPSLALSPMRELRSLLKSS